ncbi:MAG: phosphatidylserine decarboxylase [Planctomycetes bacterium]|nr:phosphatidylserine decarboxylase [Planctomycetota bacterium]
MNSQSPAVDRLRFSECPRWFRHVPLACWGWRELNLWGWPLLAVTVILLLLGNPWCWLAIVPAVLLCLLIYFFRDPKRTIPEGPNLIVSPADGTVTDVTPLPQYDFIGRPAVRVGIFLSVLNVHINRAPCTGRVLDTHYQPGEFVNAQRPDCAERNEFMWIGFEDPDAPQRRFAVRQVSGMLARKIVCTLRPGSTVPRGEKFGMIKLGSRTEVLLPADSVQVHVRPGDKVRAGCDVIGRWI